MLNRNLKASLRERQGDFLRKFPASLAQDCETVARDFFIPDGQEGMVIELHGAGIAEVAGGTIV